MVFSEDTDPLTLLWYATNLSMSCDLLQRSNMFLLINELGENFKAPSMKLNSVAIVVKLSLQQEQS